MTGPEGEAPAPARVKLAVTLDTREAGPLHETLLACRGADLVVDAGDVGFLGAQCVQVLLAAQRTWALDGRSFSVEPASDDFDSTLHLLGAGLANLGQGKAQ